MVPLYLILWEEGANIYFLQSTLLVIKVLHILEENNAWEIDSELCDNATNVSSLKDLFSADFHLCGS